MQSKKLTFKKTERLTHKIVISNLFTNGNSFTCYPFRVVWNVEKLNTPYPAQIAVTVSKRSFKLAVTRNVLKRRIKEIYRLNKSTLYEQLESENEQIAFMLLYLPKKVMTTEELTPKLQGVLERLLQEYKKLKTEKTTE